MILGDSLLVMTSLAEKEGLKGKVQTIYIDPPYGIKFGSNWQVSTRKRDVKDGKAEDVTRQPEQVRAFRDTWELGIHSYLRYLRDRLVVARELLTETGSVFVQIGDENVHLVRALLDEVFGSENFVALITFTKTTVQAVQRTTVSPQSPTTCSGTRKDRERSEVSAAVSSRKQSAAQAAAQYNLVELPDGDASTTDARRAIGSIRYPTGARVFRLDNLTSQTARETDDGLPG